MKLTELATLHNQIRDATHRRDGELTSALQVAQKFFDLCNDTMSNLRDLKDNLLSQEPPGIDSSTVKEQQKELKVCIYSKGDNSCCRMNRRELTHLRSRNNRKNSR